MENRDSITGQDENNFSQWESLTEEPEQQSDSEKDIAQKYETAEEIDKALECLYGQKEWKDNLSEIGQTIMQAVEKSKNDSNLQFRRHPYWIGQVGGPGRVKILAITNDKKYDDALVESGIERIANEDEKKFLISKNHESIFGKPSVDVDGFERPEGVKFADEIDFAFENKAENKDIPGRINHVLYVLFGENTFSELESDAVRYGMGFDDYLDAAKYPDDETVVAAANELIEIANDIGNDGKLEENINRLEQTKEASKNAAQEIAEQEETNKNQQELAKIAESINNGEKLNLESLRLIFSDKNDNDPTAISIRNNIGIEVDVIKQLLNKE